MKTEVLKHNYSYTVQAGIEKKIKNIVTFEGKLEISIKNSFYFITEYAKVIPTAI